MAVPPRRQIWTRTALTQGACRRSNQPEWLSSVAYERRSGSNARDVDGVMPDAAGEPRVEARAADG
jgi:hypothetical protein